MNSLFKTFQNVVEMGEERSRDGFSTSPHAVSDDQSDPTTLRGHIAVLTQQLTHQAQAYEELKTESSGIEKELMRVRLRYAASRELWEATNENLELAIQSLFEYHLYGTVRSAYSNTAVSTNPHGSHAGPSSSLEATGFDATYVASLHEQIRRLKEMVCRSGEERSQLRSEKQFDEAKRLLAADGVAAAHLDAEVRTALQKLVHHWQEERTGYESLIENLERSIGKHAERAALLTDSLKQERERHTEAAGAASSTAASAVDAAELARLRDELERWQRGEYRVTGATQATASAAAPSSTSPPQEKSSHDHGHGSAALPKPPSSNADGNPSVGGGAGRQHAAPAPDAALQEELERLRRDCAARDEALDGLYRDIRSLQQALQQAEARASASDAELAQCQLRTEGVTQQLSREQSRTKRLEEDYRRAELSEGKLREQVMQLRQSLAAANAAGAAAKGAFSTSNGLPAGMSIPQVPAVRVSQPYKASVLEEGVTYESAGTWEDWAREAGQWVKELRGETAPVPGLGGLHGAGISSRARGAAAGVLRRRSRMVLLFGSGLVALMFLFVLLMLVQSRSEAAPLRAEAS